jgi:hypothetical protein
MHQTGFPNVGRRRAQVARVHEAFRQHYAELEQLEEEKRIKARDEQQAKWATENLPPTVAQDWKAINEPKDWTPPAEKPKRGRKAKA